MRSEAWKHWKKRVTSGGMGSSGVTRAQRPYMEEKDPFERI
jgi:hypothetical protein